MIKNTSIKRRNSASLRLCIPKAVLKDVSEPLTPRSTLKAVVNHPATDGMNCTGVVMDYFKDVLGFTEENLKTAPQEQLVEKLQQASQGNPEIKEKLKRMMDQPVLPVRQDASDVLHDVYGKNVPMLVASLHDDRFEQCRQITDKLYCDQSTITGAGEGLFSHDPLPKGTAVSPHQGFLLQTDSAEEKVYNALCEFVDIHPHKYRVQFDIKKPNEEKESKLESKCKSHVLILKDLSSKMNTGTKIKDETIIYCSERNNIRGIGYIGAISSEKAQESYHIPEGKLYLSFSETKRDVATEQPEELCYQYKAQGVPIVKFPEIQQSTNVGQTEKADSVDSMNAVPESTEQKTESSKKSRRKEMKQDLDDALKKFKGLLKK